METKDNNYRKTIKRAANEINFLTQNVKIIVPFNGSYFMYNVGNGMYRSEYGPGWFSIESDDAFQDLVKDLCCRLPRDRRYKFEDERSIGDFYLEDEDIAVVILDGLKKIIQSYIDTDKPKIYKWTSLYNTIRNIELEFSRMILIDKIKNEFVPPLDELREMTVEQEGDLKRNVEKFTNLMMDIVNLTAL